MTSATVGSFSQGNGSHSIVLTLRDPMVHSLPGFSVHGILQTRLLEWETIPFSRGSSRGLKTQGLNPGLLHCRRILCHLNLQRSLFLGEPQGKFWFTFFPSLFTDILFILAPELSAKFIHVSPSPSPRPFFRHVLSKALLGSRLPVWAVVLKPGHTVK